MLYRRFLKCVLLNFGCNVDKDVGIYTHTFYSRALWLMHWDRQSMKLKTFTLIALLATACSRPDTRDKEIISRPLQRDSIDGVWTDGSGPNASFSIENDSTIYDVEHCVSSPKYRPLES
jgi:hypothetical protein